MVMISNLAQTKYTPKNRPVNTSKQISLPQVHVSFSKIQHTSKKIPSSKNIIAFYGNNIKPAKRLSKTDYELYKCIEEIKKAEFLYGKEAITNLAEGNPDITPPTGAINALRKSTYDPTSHRYNSSKGILFFRKNISNWLNNRFDINANPETEILVTSGASNGISTILSAYTEKGDKVLVPDLGYAVFEDLIAKHDLEKVPMHLSSENGYLPDFNELKKEDLKGVKCMILNYPHNPTGSFAPLEFYEKAVKFAKDNNMFIIHDFDNSELTHYGDKPVGLLQAKGAKDIAFQVHTLSKSHNMPGLRVGFIVSNKDFIDNAFKAKALGNTGVYTGTQAAASAALTDEEGYIKKINAEYRKRKKTAVKRLKKLGSDAEITKGTYYLWSKIPEGFSTDEFYKYVLHKGKVALTPGTLFGPKGEGYVRIVMSANEEGLNRAFDKIEKAGIRFDVTKQDLPKETQIEINNIANAKFETKTKI